MAYLSDDQQGEVEPVHEEVGDCVSDKLLRTQDVPLDEHHLQACCDHILYQQAIVTPHRLNTLRRAEAKF